MTTTGKIALFVGGTLFGSYGFKLLGSKEAKKVYTHTRKIVQTFWPMPRRSMKPEQQSMKQHLLRMQQKPDEVSDSA